MLKHSERGETPRWAKIGPPFQGRVRVTRSGRKVLYSFTPSASRAARYPKVSAGPIVTPAPG